MIRFSPFGFIAPKTLNYLSFQSLDFECTWWKLSQKRVVRTKFAIYVFLIFLLWKWPLTFTYSVVSVWNNDKISYTLKPPSDKGYLSLKSPSDKGYLSLKSPSDKGYFSRIWLTWLGSLVYLLLKDLFMLFVSAFVLYEQIFNKGHFVSKCFHIICFSITLYFSTNLQIIHVFHPSFLFLNDGK